MCKPENTYNCKRKPSRTSTKNALYVKCEAKRQQHRTRTGYLRTLTTVLDVLVEHRARSDPPTATADDTGDRNMHVK